MPDCPPARRQIGAELRRYAKRSVQFLRPEGSRSTGTVGALTSRGALGGSQNIAGSNLRAAEGSRSTYFDPDKRTLRPELKASPLDGESVGVGRMRGNVLVINACGS